MEEGQAFDEKKLAVQDESDNTSTLAPSSDKQSEPSVNGDALDTGAPVLSTLRALSNQSI